MNFQKQWQVVHPNLYTTQHNIQLKSTCDLQLFLELFLVGQHLKKCTKDCDIHCRTCCVNSSESISNNRVASIQRNKERKGRICKLCSHPSGTISPHCSSVWNFHRLTSKTSEKENTCTFVMTAYCIAL